jgi:type IV pilus assembly protein PilY1
MVKYSALLNRRYRMKFKNKNILIFTLFTALFCFPLMTVAQNMDDYTAYPPFISSGATPNLLLLIDNSASMYDLAYIDSGGGVCSGDDSISCIDDSQCPDEQTCDKSGATLRESSYCYDQTYISTNEYLGYFEITDFYIYRNARFEEEASLPTDCSHQIPGELCVKIITGDPDIVQTFAARGNYLNWLTASKLDVQKHILTGGKYDTVDNVFIPESRGCVGRKFLKEALVSDYVEGGTNTSLEIVFAVSGPPNLYNPTGISSGGQTSINIYKGNYDAGKCQDAIQQIIYASNPSAIRTSVGDCLSYDPNAKDGDRYCEGDIAKSCSVDSDCVSVDVAGDCSTGPKASRKCQAPSDPSMIGLSCVNDADCDTVAADVGPCVGGTPKSTEVTSKIVFNQNMQECWQIWSGNKTEIGNDAFSGEAPNCETLYKDYKICEGGDRDGLSCESDTDCPNGGVCTGNNGPDGIKPGNPGYMCSASYAGACASTLDDWNTTTWVSEQCFLDQYLKFCDDSQLPPVIDPSDTPDDTSETANLPAIINDIGVEAQLGEPIKSIEVRRYDTTEPTGLLHEYGDSIRFGAMSFNYNGSDSECDPYPYDDDANPLKCPRVCEIDPDIVCTTSVDCPSGECIPIENSSAKDSKDGSVLIHPLGEGFCSIDTSTQCIRDDECPTGQTCEPQVGDHADGLIHDIDEVKARSWTPFAEAYYNAIAYFARDANDNASGNANLSDALFDAKNGAITDPLGEGFDTGPDFTNCIEYRCQKNNILIISDGSSTADNNDIMMSDISSLTIDSSDNGPDTSTCGLYTGSTYLDDLSYFTQNSNIFDPTDNDTEDNEIAQNITTYVVYTGAEESTATGECAPLELMTNTAENKRDLRKAFAQVASDAASGAAVSVLATTGEGDGSVYQAYFYPEKPDKPGGTDMRTWLGYVHSLFVDKHGNLREDTVDNDTLDLNDDLILRMEYDQKEGTKVFKCDTTDEGKTVTCPTTWETIDDIKSVWSGGELLANKPADQRTIYTTANGYEEIPFTTGELGTTPHLFRAADNAEAGKIIEWVRGNDYDDYRKRDMTVNGVDGKIWKLGDIVHSTPTVVAAPMENFDLLYGDYTYSAYRLAKKNKRHAVFVGANDGMLHAFNAGCFDAAYRKYYPGVNADGTCSTSGTLGDELWSFVPRGMLPHLKWLTDPDYTHVYYVDMKPKITDVKIFNPNDGIHTNGWGTILIGGFRYGGKKINWSTGGVDYVSMPEYFALDITVPETPKLLWTFPNHTTPITVKADTFKETNFSEPGLGLSMSYPSVAKVGDDWYVIFGSGATNYDQYSNLTEFQNGNIFILKLSDIIHGTFGQIDTWEINKNYWKKTTNNTETFMSDGMSVDVDIDYDVDVMYIGENTKQGGPWNAVMHRLTTDRGVETDPAQWDLSPSGIINIADVQGNNDSAKIIASAPSAAMDDRAKLWIYFGTGMFYGSNDKNNNDTGAFYAIKDGCWDGSCTTKYDSVMDVSSATVKTDGSVSGPSDCGGGSIDNWLNLKNAMYNCDGWALYFGSRGETEDYTTETLLKDGERVLSKPLVLGGLVAWATYIPNDDICSHLGESNVYAVYYQTGTAYKKYVFKGQKDQQNPSDEIGRVQKLGEGLPSSMSAQITAGGTAKGFVQQSTGSILEIESITPYGLKSDVTGWRSEEIQ